MPRDERYPTPLLNMNPSGWAGFGAAIVMWLPLIESPGHVVSSAEHELILGMFAIAMFYGFTAYLYFAHGTTVLGWEGEMLDFWTSDQQRLIEAQHVFAKNGLVRPPADA